MLTDADMGEGGVKNHWKSADVIYGWSLVSNWSQISISAVDYFCNFFVFQARKLKIIKMQLQMLFSINQDLVKDQALHCK